MKKIIGFLGTGALALGLFMNVNSANGSSVNLDLANLVTLNSANAECPEGDLGICQKNTAGTDTCWANSGYGNKCK